MLLNAEVWYCLNTAEIKPLIDLDKYLLRKILHTPVSTPSESIYLELGCLDIETIVKARRINYLHYILKKDSNEMLFKFFMAQWKYSGKQDWAELVRKDLEDFDIPADFSMIKSKSANSFKTLVSKKAKVFAFRKLMSMKSNHSKLIDLDYNDH